MVTIKKLKQWLLSLTVAFFTILISKPGFASMGSTGGGGGGGSAGGGAGGGAGSGGGFSSPVIRSANDSPFWKWLFVFNALAYAWFYFMDGIKNYPKFRRIKSDLKEMDLDSSYTWLLRPNQTIAQFNKGYADLDSSYGRFKPDQLISLYSQAQFNYGDAIRRKVTGQSDYLTQLQDLLGFEFLITMDTEIKLKARNGIIDDVVINHGVIDSFKTVNDNVIVAEVKVVGRDREINVNNDFEPSFARESWEDYVVFGRSNDGWKIYNLVYGEHFHVNGTDYNHQDSLLENAKYQERKLPEVDDTLLQVVRDYQRKAKLREKLGRYFKMFFLAGVYVGIMLVLTKFPDEEWITGTFVLLVTMMALDILLKFVERKYVN